MDLDGRASSASSGTDIEEVDSDRRGRGLISQWELGHQHKTDKVVIQVVKDRINQVLVRASQNQAPKPSDKNPETLKRLKERLNKRQAKNSNHQSKSTKLLSPPSS